MKIYVTVKPNAKEERVRRMDDTHYSVAVKAPPTDNKANQAARRLLATHFGVAKSLVRILSGHTSKKKIVEINY